MLLLVYFFFFNSTFVSSSCADCSSRVVFCVSAEFYSLSKCSSQVPLVVRLLLLPCLDPRRLLSFHFSFESRPLVCASRLDANWTSSSRTCSCISSSCIGTDSCRVPCDRFDNWCRWQNTNNRRSCMFDFEPNNHNHKSLKKIN